MGTSYPYHSKGPLLQNKKEKKKKKKKKEKKEKKNHSYRPLRADKTLLGSRGFKQNQGHVTCHVSLSQTMLATAASPRGHGLLLAPCRCSSPAVSTVPDLEVLISTAASTGRLDLSDCGLTEVPREVLKLSQLVDLSLAGNRITCLPEDIHELQCLERLGVPGNCLTTLPEGIGKLKNLRGLWLQGNRIESIPREIGDLEELQTLSLAGNKLKTLPDTIGRLSKLRYLSVAGNMMAEIPAGLGCLGFLRVLALYGNSLCTVPDTIGRLSSLEELWLQGNSLQEIPRSLHGLASLKQLSVSDNQLRSLPASIGELTALETLSVYGNNVRGLPAELQSMKQLQNIWLEGNPFEIESLGHTVLPGQLKRVGLSSSKVSMELPPDLSAQVLFSEIGGTGIASSSGGYFKLSRYNDSDPSLEDASVVVVAFGSAPAVPNWGGVLNRIKQEMESAHQIPAYDVLYVVDSWHSWYTRHKHPTVDTSAAVMGSYYRRELEVTLKNYRRVIMLGDSMGASAALLFSDLATSVLAFCPQVDLLTSVMRPGEDDSWLQAYGKVLLESVSKSNAKIAVHCGNFWQDCAQVRLLPEKKVNIVAHSHVDNHRLTKQMSSDGNLVHLVRAEIDRELTL